MTTGTLDPPRTASAKYIARSLRVFIRPGSTFEVRAIGVDARKKTASGLFRDFDKAAQAIIALENRKPSGIYFVMNEINPALYARSPERLKDFPDQTTSDKDVIRRHWLLIDVDPDRPAGISSTDNELAAAVVLATDVRDWLTERMGFLEPVEAMSGNGFHLLFPVDLPNDAEAAALVQAVLEAVKAEAAKLQDPNRPPCKIDTAVFNAARITKVYGTMTAKGGETPDCPHRRSHLVHIPSGLNWESPARPFISRDRLEAVAALAPRKQAKPDPKPSKNGNHRLMVDAYLQDAGVDFRHETAKDGADKYILDPCPFNPDHRGKDAVIFQTSEGKLTFNCFHDGCKGQNRTWHDVKAVYGEPRPEHYDPPKPERTSQQQTGERHADAKPEEKPILAGIRFADLKAKYPNLKPEIVQGIAREAETIGIHAKSKMGKTWFAYLLALSVASGCDFLGRHRCKQGRVCIIDNELHPENLAHRIPKVADKMGLDDGDWQQNLSVVPLRGQLRNIFELRQFFESVGDCKLFIVDALYRMLPPGISENDNAAMAEVFNAIDSYAAMTGAAIAFVHHASKGNQSEKDVTDVGSGAGSIARAVDSHLILRPHEEPDHVVLDGAVRSFAPMEPVVLRWEFPLWEVARDMDPTQLKGKKSAGEERQSEKDREGKDDILQALKDGQITRRKLRPKVGMGKDRLDRLIAQLIKSGDVQELKIGEQEMLQLATRSAGLDF